MFSNLSRFFARVSAWQDRARAIRELSQMDDRALADIGISRGTISAVVRGRDTAQPVGAIALAANANAPRRRRA
jgi:uncharacterized protein YjiS (DUF1127 family)